MIPGPATPSHWPQQQWGARDLWSRLEPLLPGLSVQVVARSASTNTDLLERARIAPNARASGFGNLHDHPDRVGRRQADTQPCLLVAEHQTAGRGRLGRSWRSARGASLTFSLALPLAPRDWSGLSLAVGVALAEAMQPTVPAVRLGLKWPNDLWIVDGAAAWSGRKLGGVLIETLAAGEQRLAVIGIGINIARMPEPLPIDLQDRLAYLRELDAAATAPETLARIALPLVLALKTFERDGFGAFIERHAAHDLLRDQAIETTDSRAPGGIARGVDRQGALRVETADGVQLISSGEVSVRPKAGAESSLASQR